MVVKLLDWGGIITDIEVPDRTGTMANVTLGLTSLEQYQTVSPYFGAIIGRYANRIANHQFTLDGTTYVLSKNNGPNTLHGGKRGWDKRLWTATEVSGAGFVGVQLDRKSPDGEMGFPGKVNATVTITLTDDNKIDFVYHAVTNAPTVINMTNHSYFNLRGEGTGNVFDTMLYLNADGYTPVDANLIPTGAITPVAGTAFDFTTPTPIGARIHDGDPQIVIAHGFDHNWVLNRPAGDTSLILAATAEPGAAAACCPSGRPSRASSSTPATSSTARWSARAATPTARATGSRSRPSTTRLAEPAELPVHRAAAGRVVRQPHGVRLQRRRVAHGTPPSPTWRDPHTRAAGRPTRPAAR